MTKLGTIKILGALLALLLGTAGGFREEFDCEEAVAHLVDCCPGFDPTSVQCGAGCSSVEIGIDNAECLRKASCETLRDSGACGQPTQTVCE